MFVDIEKQISIKEALNANTGREKSYCFDLTRNFYTEGIKQMVELCNASWLLSIVLKHSKKLSNEFGLIEVKFKYLKSISNNEAIVLYQDENNNTIAKNFIEFTDFPLQEITLFYQNNTLFLPSER